MKDIISWVLRHVPRKYLQLVSHFGVKVLSVFYRGKGVECSVCGSEFRKFLPYGRSGRDNALCPSCLSLERHRLMYLYLQRKTPFFKADLKLLHVAPEYCFIDRFEKMKNLDYITADIESPLAKVKMDIHQIPFEANTFDVTFCNHVMEHVDDDIKAMSELHRVLKPGAGPSFNHRKIGQGLRPLKIRPSPTPKSAKSTIGRTTTFVFLGVIMENALKKLVLE